MAVQEHGGANSQGAETLKHKVSPGNEYKKKKGCIFWVSDGMGGCMKLPICETSRRRRNCAAGTKGQALSPIPGKLRQSFENRSRGRVCIWHVAAFHVRSRSFLLLSFFLFFLLLSTFFFSTLDSVSTWDWRVDIRTPAKKVMRTYLGEVTAYHNGEHMRHISWLLIHA